MAERYRTRPGLTVLFTAAVVMTAALLALTVDVWRTNAPVALDRAATRLGFGAGEEGLLGHDPRLARIAESIGSPMTVGIGAFAVLFVALVLRDWTGAAVALLAPVGAFFIIEYLAKPVINDPIPYGGRSYPSGHAAGVAAVATAAVLVFYRRWGIWGAVAFTPVAIVAVLIVGLGVLGLNFHHYATDVIGGAVLGAADALILRAVFAAGSRHIHSSATRDPTPGAHPHSGADGAE